jgi:hypothetical protein
MRKSDMRKDMNVTGVTKSYRTGSEFDAENFETSDVNRHTLTIALSFGASQTIGLRYLGGLGDWAGDLLSIWGT